LHKELDLIQACIKKNDDRGTLIRGWNISTIVIVCSISQTSIVVHSTPNNVMFLLLLLVVNAQFYMVGINNSKKKYQAVKLYEWVTKNRDPETDPKVRRHLYSLDLSRFELTDFKSSDFSKAVYGLSWAFLLSLMIWNTILGFDKKSEAKSHSSAQKADSLHKK
jgi:hypothetical protein